MGQSAGSRPRTRGPWAPRRRGGAGRGWPPAAGRGRRGGAEAESWASALRRLGSGRAGDRDGVDVDEAQQVRLNLGGDRDRDHVPRADGGHRRVAGGHHVVGDGLLGGGDIDDGLALATQVGDAQRVGTGPGRLLGLVPGLLPGREDPAAVEGGAAEQHQPQAAAGEEEGDLSRLSGAHVHGYVTRKRSTGETALPLTVTLPGSGSSRRSEYETWQVTVTVTLPPATKSLTLVLAVTPLQAVPASWTEA